MSTTTLSPIGLRFPLLPSLNAGSRLARWFGLAPARPLTRTEEAANVRAMASRLQENDARFASDLYAAADHHELIG